jgi:hypothetical protein
VKLYFDSNIYDAIVKATEVGIVRRWLRASGHRVEASLEANVVEALRAPAPLRAQLVAATTSVGLMAYPPRDYGHYGEVAVELARLRPDWFVRPLDSRRRELFLRRRKRVWAKLRTHPRWPLRELFLPWCADNDITSPEQLDTKTLTRFYVLRRGLLVLIIDGAR